MGSLSQLRARDPRGAADPRDARARPSAAGRGGSCAASSPRPSRELGVSHVSDAGGSGADAARRAGASAGGAAGRRRLARRRCQSSACSTWRPTSPRWRSWPRRAAARRRAARRVPRVLSVRLRPSGKQAPRMAAFAEVALGADRGPSVRRLEALSAALDLQLVFGMPERSDGVVLQQRRATCGPSKAPWPPTARSISGRTTRRSSPPARARPCTPRPSRPTRLARLLRPRVSRGGPRRRARGCRLDRRMYGPTCRP